MGVPVLPVVPTERQDLEALTDATSGGLDARRMENFITESIAKGVELSAIESRSAVASPLTGENQVAAAAVSSSATSTQPQFSLGSASISAIHCR